MCFRKNNNGESKRAYSTWKKFNYRFMKFYLLITSNFALDDGRMGNAGENSCWSGSQEGVQESSQLAKEHFEHFVALDS